MDARVYNGVALAPSLHADVPKRQVLLSLAVLAVPCVVVCGLGFQLLRQEGVLEARRAEEGRRREVARVETELLANLERVKLQVLGGSSHDAVALIAEIHDGRLNLDHGDSERFRASLHSLDFGAAIRRAEQEESALRLNEAEQLYRAIPVGRADERAYANLLLARTLKKAGRTTEASQVIDSVLRTPANYRDEFGIPFALYSAGVHSNPAGALRSLSSHFATFSSAALFKAREIALSAGTNELLPTLDRWIGDRRRAEKLHADFHRFSGRLQTEERVWLAWGERGEPMWLLSAMPNNRALIAVDPSRMRPPIIFSKRGELLGANFPGLRIEVPQGTNTRAAGIRFQFLALGLVIVLTLLAGFLISRDVERSLRFAEMQAEFVASVSHELRTPLTSIRMFAELLRINDDIEPDLKAEHLNTILTESERLSRLVERVLLFSRIEQGKQTYQRRRQSLEAVVEAAARAFGAHASHSGFRFSVECDAKLPDVEVDSDAIAQAILNLLSNAVKYSGMSREIGLRLLRQGGNAVIQVVDHGVGIAAEEQRKIFNRFYRVPSEENLQVSGTGLGLTLVRHVAEAHGGTVQVESHPGAGSTFSIVLPLCLEGT